MTKSAAEIGNRNPFIPAHSQFCRAANRLDDALMAAAALSATVIALIRLLVS
ncbi:hypothetical protein [Tianweitania sediminis]|uniref:Uncharacterized protein n=1 Tax=Tianweitania sediminis TaxID=1502156 RepID=A0A8J7R097_9HYPH|nr:hypothetical protein [Tianweitania sediminis]MBP0439475.1 hypothetical protein [Tianweitania sediminis]